MPEFGEGVLFELADPFAADAELGADLLVGGRLVSAHAEAEGEDLLVPVREGAEGDGDFSIQGFLLDSNSGGLFVR